MTRTTDTRIARTDTERELIELMQRMTQDERWLFVRVMRIGARRGGDWFRESTRILETEGVDGYRAFVEAAEREVQT